MATLLSTVLKTLPDWMTQGGDEGDIAIASMGRLVRNLPGHPFPGWSSEKSRRAVVDALLPALLSRPGLKRAFHADMAELNLQKRRLLLERKLITPCMAARQSGCHIILPRRQDVTIMLNEEEHFVAHFFRHGCALNDLLAGMQRFALSLEDGGLEFAHDAAHGYLTSLPSEAGEGMQFYSVLHLPALTMADTAEQIARGLEKLQLNLAPYYSGMQEDTGNTYIIFTNAVAAGEAQETVDALEEVVHTLVLREQQMRDTLMSTRLFDFADRMGRAFGLLCYAMRLSYRELLDALSLLRLGTVCGMVTWERDEEILGSIAALNTTLAPTHLTLQPECAQLPTDFHPVLRSMLLKEIFVESSPCFTSPYLTQTSS